MSEVTGGFSLYRLRNGKSAYVAIGCDKQLVQVVALDGDGNVSAIAPDWTTPAEGTNNNQPTISLQIATGMKATDLQWYYNNQLIIFPSSKFSISADLLSLKIISNLASKDNLFTDTISVKGKLLDSAGYYAGDIDKSMDIPIYKASANGYMVLIDATSTTISSDNPTTTLTAKTLQGAQEIVGFTNYKWYSGLNGTVIGTGKTLSVNRDMVNGYQVFICKAFSSGNVELDAESVTIYDASDNINIYYSVASSVETMDNLTSSYTIPANAGSCTVTPHLFLNNVEKTGVSWTMTKLHGDTKRPIVEIDGNTDATSDSDSDTSTNNYNTTTTGNIVILEKDSTSIVGAKKSFVEVTLITRADY